MTVTEREFAGSKLTYHHWTRDTANANAGTIAVTHSADSTYVRRVTVLDMLSYGGVPSVVPDDQRAIVFTDNSTTTVTNNCGTASIGAAAADAGNTGVATTPTSGGTYTGKADGTMTLTAVNAGELGTAASIGSAVYAGSGSANTETAAGTYTGYMSGNIVLTCLTTGELGTATFYVTFPDGTYVARWVSGATTVATAVGQGVTLAMTSGAGDDCVAGDTVTIPVVSCPSVKVDFPDGTSDYVRLGATTVATTMGQGVTFALTADTGTDVEVGDIWTIALAAATKDIKVIVSIVGD